MPRLKEQVPDLRLRLALGAGRLTSWLCRLGGFPGTSLPGVVGLRLFPGLVRELAAGYKIVVAVTGTNGKTTTANLLAHILRAAGHNVAHNSEGANMLPGVATALMRDCDLAGRARADVALLEVDEGSVEKVFGAARPDLVVVTNYFRDQLDRYFELERLTALLRRAVAELPGARLLLNADDPLAAAAGRDLAGVSYYGLEDPGREYREGATFFGEEAREARYCSCGMKLQYTARFYGQLGHYSCPRCGFRRPDPDFAARAVRAGPGGVSFALARAPGGVPGAGECAAPLRGFYNTYNVLAALSAALLLGVPWEVARRAVSSYRTATGRMEEFVISGLPCTLALIKNPVGANEVLRVVAAAEGKKAVLVAINDLAADGRDVSWLWDAEFGFLAAPDVVRVVCSGRRAHDLAVCLKYSGLEPKRISVAPGLREGLALLVRARDEGAERLFVLATYTNLFPLARLLSRCSGGVGPCSA